MTTPTTATAPAAAYHRARAASGPIVVASNGSEGAGAVATAARLAERAGAPVVVVSAVEPALPAPLGVDGTIAWAPDLTPLLQLQRERVQRQLRDTLGEGAAAWPIEMAIDSPARAVANSARAHHASLVVLGIGRHDLAARLLGGEVALRAIRRASVPVLAVSDAPFPVPPRTAVAAMDFSPSSVLAARAALDMLAPGGTLHLVHVWSRTVIDHPALVAQDDDYERALPRRFAQVESALLDRARDVTILPATLPGHPAEALVEFAASHGADLVAAGRQGHGLVERLLVGRVTTALVRASRCAVLVTPEPSPADRVRLELALTGTARSLDREQWGALLDAFSRRNVGRRATLEIDDPELGAQAQETGYTFLGATYDHHDGRVAIMLGAPEGTAAGAHLTRAVEGVMSVAIHEAGGRDAALAVGRGDGQTLLTFLPDASP